MGSRAQHWATSLMVLKDVAVLVSELCGDAGGRKVSLQWGGEGRGRGGRCGTLTSTTVLM